jgi:tetratricopeptide (TPR) repeat protein
MGWYRQKCMTCHTEQSCRVQPLERRKTTAADSCMECHMPRGKTDIPHVSFTHHRIGVHKPNPAAASPAAPHLTPTESIAHLAPIDQKRNLGLAYVYAKRQPEYAKYAGPFTNRARELLLEVYAEGLRDDAETLAALANLFLPIDPERSRAFAREALQAKALTDEPRANALVLLAAAEMRDRKFESATDLLKELVSLRRSGEDWAMLGISYQMRKMPREAVPAFEKALAIRPNQPPIQFKLAEAYHDLGDDQRAQDHRAKGSWLSQKQGK